MSGIVVRVDETSVGTVLEDVTGFEGDENQAGGRREMGVSELVEWEKETCVILT